MKAVVLKSFGGPEVLSISEVPTPQPGSEEILIKIQAVGVNRADLLERQGMYPPPGPTPTFQIPGLECAGTVVSVGQNVQQFAPGDRVMALLSGGGYAQYTVCHERLALPIPTHIETIDAGGIPEVFLTAYDALFDKASLTMGDRVLIHAGASGVGSAAIQLARSAGLRIASTVGSQPKQQAAQGWGADLVINYRDHSWLKALREWAPEGVQGVLDFIGQSYFSDNLDSLSPGGALVVIGTLSGNEAAIPLGKLLARRLTIRGTALRSRPLEDKMRLVQQFRGHALHGADKGDWAPVVDRVFNWQHVADAHRYMASNGNIGKIILAVD